MRELVHKYAAEGNIDAMSSLCMDCLKKLTSDGLSAMNIAIQEGHSHVLSFFLERCPELVEISNENQNHNTVLHDAIHYNRLDMLVQLLPYCSDSIFCQCNDDNESAAIVAVQRGHLDLLTVLVASRPTLIESSSNTIRPKQTLLECAIFCNHAHIVQYLLQVYETSAQTAKTPLHEFFEWPSTAILEMLIAADANFVCRRNKHGLTPFLDTIATHPNGMKRFQFLLSKCPNVIYDKSWGGSNALHIAKSIQVARKLVQLRPELLQEVTFKGNNVLHVASSADIAQFLIDQCPELCFQKNNDGFVPLQVFKDPSITNVLLKNNPAHFVISHFNGHSSLHLAVVGSNDDVIKLVFEHQKDTVNTCDTDGKTPFDLVLDYNNYEMMLLFYRHVTINITIKLQWRCMRNFAFDMHRQIRDELNFLSMCLCNDLVTHVHEYLGISTNKKHKHNLLEE